MLFITSFTGGASVSEKPVATSGAGGLRDSAGNFAQWLPNFGDRLTLCSFRAGDDSQRNSSTWRGPLFFVLSLVPLFLLQ